MKHKSSLRRYSISLFIALLFITSTASAQSIDELLKEVNGRFYFKGEPIHPELLHLFNSSMSDAPIVMTVDLCTGFHSNLCYHKTAVDGKIVTEHLNDRDGNQQGTYEYEYLGKLDNGVHVVRTLCYGELLGASNDLLFISFKIRKTYDYNGKAQEQLLMTLERCYNIGDRLTSKVTLSKNTVTINKPIGSNKPVVVSFPEGQ